MYYIRKSSSSWFIHNRNTRKSRALSQQEIDQVIEEFPLLQHAKNSAQSTTLFRPTIKSIEDLP